MANFDLAELRLVNPREGWPNEKARAAASGADHVLDQPATFPSVAEAIADLGFVYATTARAREVAKPVTGPRGAALHIVRTPPPGAGPGRCSARRAGLTNEDLSLADEILTFPVEPGFASINLAQAVLLFGYEWRLAGFAPGGRPARLATGGRTGHQGRPDPPVRASRIRRSAGRFLRRLEKRPHMVSRSARCSSAPASPGGR